MSKFLSTIALIAAGAATAIAAGMPAAADNGPNQPHKRSSCAFVRSIYNFKEIDDYTAIVQTSPSKRFLVRFANSCRELKWSYTARVESNPGVCLSPGDKIVVGRHGFRERCWIKSIEPLDRDQPMPVSNY